MSETLNVNQPCDCGLTDACKWPLRPGYACKIGCFTPLEAEAAALRAKVAELEQERDRAPWRCFHCEAVFTDREAAEEHFGLRSAARPPTCDDAGMLAAIFETFEQYGVHRNFHNAASVKILNDQWKDRLEASKKLYEMTLANELRWMRKTDQLETQLAEQKEGHELSLRSFAEHHVAETEGLRAQLAGARTVALSKEGITGDWHCYCETCCVVRSLAPEAPKAPTEVAAPVIDIMAALRESLKHRERVLAEAPKAEEPPESMLCSDCPPANYPTNKTRCAKCPKVTEATNA